MWGENESSGGRVGVRQAVGREGGKKNMTSCPAGSVSSSLDSL